MNRSIITIITALALSSFTACATTHEMQQAASDRPYAWKIRKAVEMSPHAYMVYVSRTDDTWVSGGFATTKQVTALCEYYNVDRPEALVGKVFYTKLANTPSGTQALDELLFDACGSGTDAVFGGTRKKPR